MIGRLLGHTNHQSTARYAHLDDEHLLGAAQQVGDAAQNLLTRFHSLRGAQLRAIRLPARRN